jgi:hypothetical protein
LIDVPDDVAENIDNYLTEYESKKCWYPYW